MDRVQPKENYNPELAVLGTFTGLNSNSFLASTDVTYASKITNAYISGKGVIKGRQGSKISAGFFNVVSGASTDAFKFTFDEHDYIIAKVGRFAYLSLLDSTGLVTKTLTKANIYPAVSENDKSQFTIIVDDDVCWVLSSQENTSILAFCLIKRTISQLTITDANNFTGVISKYPDNNSSNASNTILFKSSGAYLPATTISQSTFTYTINSSAHGLTSSDTVNAYLFYAAYTVAAFYYPGNYLYNSSVRSNIIPLDVNVEVSAQILDSPLLYEDSPDISANVIKAFQTPTTAYSEVSLPTTATEYTFTDGTFSPGAAVLTSSPEYMSFGALQTPTDSTYVHQFRLRQIPGSKGVNVSVSQVNVFVDKVLAAPTYYTSTGAVTTTNSVKYFGNIRPSLSSVVEVMSFFPISASTPVKLDDNSTISIGDGYYIPLYGLSQVANIFTSKFPTNIVAVGNRIVYSGLNNKIAVSNADWRYRGISWNNIQVSSIDFSDNSAYLVSLLQGASIVTALDSVNGVLIAGTDVGTFRISGTDATTPPNASTAFVSKIADGKIKTNRCLLVWEGKVYIASKFGLYQLQYKQESEDIDVQSLSTPVQDYFLDNDVEALTYSEYYRSFMIELSGVDELLVYNLNSSTFSTFKPTFAGSFEVQDNIDGYGVRLNQTDGNYTYWICQWSDDSTDLANVGLFSPPSTLATTSRSITVNGLTDASYLCTPAEVLDSLDGIDKAYGRDNVTSSTSRVVLDSIVTGNVPYPVLSFYVSKAFVGDRLGNAMRLRSLLLLVAGIGEGKFTIVGRSNNSKGTSRYVYELTGAGVKTKDDSVFDLINSDVDWLKLRTAGVNNFFYFVAEFSGVELVGYQLDLSSQGTKTLH